MLYVKFDGEMPVGVSEEHQNDPQWQNRNDWKSFEQVTRIARLLSINTARHFVGVDQGENCYPRFDIIEAPKVGDLVSYGFNGDYYPDGNIVGVTKTLQVTTSTGNRYFRKKNTSTWVKAGGTWMLVQGHRNERNPSF